MYKNRAEVVHKVYGLIIQNIRLGRSGGNVSSDVMQYYYMHGIHVKNSPAYEPQRNRATERPIQEHWNRTHVLRFASNFLNKLLGEAMYFSNWLRNRLPSKRIKNKIPILFRNAN